MSYIILSRAAQAQVDYDRAQDARQLAARKKRKAAIAQRMADRDDELAAVRAGLRRRG